MSTSIFLIVILAAFLHASWNGLVKSESDKTVSMGAVVLGQGLFGLAIILFSPIPHIESWFYILFGVVLHLGYQFFLIAAYRIGDLTQVYPIARGFAPILVTAFSILWLGVQFELYQFMAIGLIVCGIMSLSSVRQSDGMRNGTAALLATVTGCFIAAYSINDGIGVRLSNAPFAFYGWIAFLNGVVFYGLVPFWKPQVLGVLKNSKNTVVIGGGASFAAYALVVYAFNHAPIALVTALRETSIIFALLIGVFHLKEQLNLAKVISTFLTLAGATVLRFSKG